MELVEGLALWPNRSIDRSTDCWGRRSTHHRMPGSHLTWLDRSIDSQQVGDVAPDFQLKDQNGKLVKLSSFKGKKEVVS